MNTTRTRITTTTRISIQVGMVPEVVEGVAVGMGVNVWVGVVVTGVGVAAVRTAWVGLTTTGAITEMNPGIVVVLWPPEFTAVRLTE